MAVADPDEPRYGFRFSLESQVELAEIVEYYNSHPNPENGRRFLNKVENVVNLLRCWPEAGAAVPEVDGVRGYSIPKYPYRLYYTILGDELEILGISIYHAKRDMTVLVETLEQRKDEASTRL
ncbi:MAG: type II toxin-antitoxin system RelE/ParE family toxin [Propionibacteriaceae bacterium]|jgi:plasmid stabilization system protein ParE|nr:type II toxin-antitoxin system RelE/ParE family toxin [Propionibacteriaceae bacterium]